MQYTVVDIETTGLSAYYHKITEIAAFKYQDGRIIDEFSTLVNPETPIPRFITKLTGITDEMVAGKPTIKKTIPKFVEFLGDSTFVGHNAGFDFKFLDQASQSNLSVNLSNHKLCTCRLARRLLPELPSKKLSSLCEHFEIKNSNAHRAKSDALATVSIFHNFISMLKEKGIEEHKDIIDFQKSKIPKNIKITSS